MKELTESERAYRRGCLQVIQFAKSYILGGSYTLSTQANLARLEQALIKGRVSTEPKYLGEYMDTIMKELMK